MNDENGRKLWERDLLCAHGEVVEVVVLVEEELLLLMNLLSVSWGVFGYELVSAN